MFQRNYTCVLAFRLQMALIASGAWLLPTTPAQAQAAPASLTSRPALSIHDESLLANAPFDSPEAIRGALARGARVDVHDEQGRTALILAAGYNPDTFSRTYEHIRSLLKNSGGAQQTGLGYSGNRITFSLRDAQGLRSEAAQYLLGLGARQTTDSQTGQIVLTWDADNSGNTTTLQILLDAGANINARDNKGKTALMVAVQNDNPAAAQLLLDRGSDFNAADNAGLTALGYAASRGNTRLVQALQAKGATGDARSVNGAALLRFAIGQGNNAQVRDLLDKGAVAGGDGFLPPLMQAINADNAEAARLLIEHGANVNKRDRFGGAPLTEALRFRHEEAARVLIEKGAEPNGMDVFRRSNLLLAAESGSPEIVKALLDKGANPNAPDDSGTTPLHVAVWSIWRSTRRADAPVVANRGEMQNLDTLAVVTLLLDRGADVNARTKEGATPLLNALAWSRGDVARLLIQRGADANLKNNKGESPLRRALATRQTDIAELLRAAGAKE